MSVLIRSLTMMVRSTLCGALLSGLLPVAAATATASDILQHPPSALRGRLSTSPLGHHYPWQTVVGGTIILLLTLALIYANRRLVTLRRQTLRDAERLKEAQHLARLGSWELDLSNNRLTWSDEIFSIFEIDRQHFSADYEAFLKAIHPDDRACVDATFKGSLASGEPYMIEHRLLMADGRVKYVREEGKTIRDVEGRPLRSIGTVQEISDQYRQQQLLRESEERYQRFTGLTSDFVHICERTADGEFRIRWVAGSVQRLTGYTEEELMAMGCWLHILHPDDQADAAATLRGVTPGESETIEFRIIRKDGEERWLRSNSYCTCNDDDRILIYGTISDISERKHYEEAILDASFAVLEANRAKSEFLANMSHEIRTPMNGIIGMSQLLHFTELTTEQKDYLENIELSATNLLALINDILDLSKIEAGRAEIAPADFSLREVVSSAIKTQLPHIRSKGLQLRTEIAAEIPDTLFGDDLRLKQILLNLLSNATKFTHAGTISVAVNLSERHDDHVLLSFRVQDSGVGINEEARRTLFSPFCQGDSSTTRRFGGTGLGLSICRKLLDLMGGRIWFESTAGVGSTFFFELPFTVREPSPQRDRAPVTAQPLPFRGGPPLTILIAEDNEINLKLAVMLLQKLGHTSITAANGAEAVQQWRSVPLDVILMDVQMPDVDGVAALHVIRDEEATSGKHTPVIALTAHALIGDRERFLAEGFDGYLTKPFSLDRLAKLLGEIQPTNRAAALQNDGEAPIIAPQSKIPHS